MYFMFHVQAKEKTIALVVLMAIFIMGNNVCVKDLIEYGKYQELPDDYGNRTKFSVLMLILVILLTGIITLICLTLLFIYFMEQFKKKKDQKLLKKKEKIMPVDNMTNLPV